MQAWNSGVQGDRAMSKKARFVPSGLWERARGEGIQSGADRLSGANASKSHIRQKMSRTLLTLSQRREGEKKYPLA